MMKAKMPHIIAAVFFALLLATACDKVDEGLVVTNEQNIPVNTDTVFVLDSVIVNQKQVLLEDFTGHKCVNCPEAAIVAHEWAEMYDHRLIIYAVHAGFQATPDASGLYTYDFRNPTGDALFNYFNEPFNPSGTVNRVEYDGSTVLLFVTGDWEEAIPIELAKPSVIDMKVVSKYFPNSSSVLINITSTVNSALDSKYKIVVLLAEDLIIRPQRNNNEEIGPVPDWVDYHHLNVLRDGVTSTFGEYMTADGTVSQGETYYNQFYYELDQPWVSDTADYNIISFIFDEANDEILQVAELGIKKEE